jgi:hypothetical protein
MLTLNDAQKAEVLRDVYKKHAEELRAIEDAELKFAGLELGIIGAGATFIGGMKTALPLPAKAGLSLVVLALVIAGLFFAWRRNSARVGTRNLLLRCEEALGFYGQGMYLPAQSLYPPEYREYSSQGKWLALTYLFVLLAAADSF